MALKKDKEKVLDEVWTEQRVKDFLTVQTAEGSDADFHVLLKAYQSMRLENFEEFIGFFVAEGRNLNATGPAGDTVLSIIKQHRKSADYTAVLTSNGAI
ncbi:PA4642 family protein [Oceanicoccus sp. KOV_DT_Chl]|uniref:PA4642 family protein n=1 Tax=Oceanicoccus sp. KOV_DT_Chl TaxID=1904639 RepID=UPI000C7E3D3D|nr:PA4642 family protein [Oceanicoccus sp. KOV_DT_Chl]